ncbi:MAG: hypothetical protein ABJA10_07840 [Aestuariivirga sp.]
MPDSPTAVETVVASPTVAPVSSNVDVKSAEPSTAKPQIEGSQYKSMVDVVKTALDNQPSSSPKLENSSDPTKVAGEASKDPEDLSPDEVAQLTLRGQLRIRQLSNRVNSLREQVAASDKKVAEHDEFQSVMQKNRVSPEDAKSTLEIVGLMRTDPTEALNRLYPIVTELLKSAGVTLPEDLQKEVEGGKLSPERAREIAASRMNLQRSSTQSQERDEQAQADAQQRHVDALSGAADAWVAEKVTSDPDWSRKADRVTQLVKLHLLETREFPKTLPAMRELLEAKLKTVDAELKGFMPKPTAIDPPKTPGASPAGSPAPKSFLDVVKAAAGSA